MRIISPGDLNSRQMAQIISVVSSSSSPVVVVVAAELEGGLAGAAGEPKGAADEDEDEEEAEADGAAGSEGEEAEVGNVPRCFLLGTGKVGSLSMSGCGMPVNCCAFISSSSPSSSS